MKAPVSLSNREYSARVDTGTFPEQVGVPLDAPFVNENGVIQNILLERFTSLAIIKSVPGAIRANHYHKTDWHYAYVLTGSIWYYWRPVGSGVKPQRATFTAGQMFFTPPNVEHAMFFPEATDFITMAKNIRDTEHHESDVVRVKLIEAKAAADAERGWQISFPTAP
jgi:dTDP-4-dehydrorhamnose 3,5-epimerase-like enzyme